MRPGFIKDLLAGKTAFDGKSLFELEQERDIMSSEFELLTTMVDQLDNDAYRWLVNDFLPMEIRRIERARGTLEPDDIKAQCMVQGQLNEISDLTTRLYERQSSALKLRTALAKVNNLIAERRKQENGNA